MPRIITIRSGSVDLTRWVSQRLGFSNPILGRVINVSCDSDLRGKDTVFAPFDYILDPELTWWNSNETSTQHWYQVDLLSLNIFLQGYLFDLDRYHYSHSWQVKGTNDSTLPEESWTLIDSQELDKIPDDAKNTYSCDNPGFFRFLRFVTNTTNFDHKNYMTLGKLYLYGNLIWSACSTFITPKLQTKTLIFLLLFKE